jgi:hypothetical protein
MQCFDVIEDEAAGGAGPQPAPRAPRFIRGTLGGLLRLRTVPPLTMASASSARHR